TTLHRAWPRPIHRLAAAIGATACSPRRARMVSAGCRRRSKETSCLNGLVTLWRPPTIKPIVARAQFFSAHSPHREVTSERFRARQPINATLAPGELLGSRGPVPARALIGPQRVRWIIEIFVQHVGDDHCVFDRH